MLIVSPSRASSKALPSEAYGRADVPSPLESSPDGETQIAARASIAHNAHAAANAVRASPRIVPSLVICPYSTNKNAICQTLIAEEARARRVWGIHRHVPRLLAAAESSNSQFPIQRKRAAMSLREPRKPTGHMRVGFCALSGFAMKESSSGRKSMPVSDSSSAIETM